MDSAHLENSVRVVGDRAIGIHREDEAGGGEQTQSGERDSVELERERFAENHHRADNRERDHHQRPHRGFEPFAMPGQNQRGRPGSRRGRGLGDRSAIGMGEIVGEPERDDRQYDSQGRREGEAPVGSAGARVVEVEIVDDEESDTEATAEVM